MRDASPQLRSRALLALDIAILVVIVGFLLSFVVVRRDLHQYNDDATAIAQWARAQGVTRIAWPDDKREAVPALLGEDVTPVLVPATTPPAQQLAVNDTAVVVTTDPEYLAPMSSAMFQTGPFTARVVDLAAARRVPPADGESLGEQISRPYVYSPLRKSARIVGSKPWVTRVTLASGHYVFSAAVFDPVVKASATMNATMVRTNRQLGTATTPLQAQVNAPTVLEFDVAGKDPVAVDLKISVSGPLKAASSAFMHEWQLLRQDQAS